LEGELMGYYLYDARGYVGDLASIHGLHQLSEYVGKASQVPLVKKFFKEGQALVTEDLIAGFRSLHPEDIDVAKTIDNLLQLLIKCDSIAIISDGVGIECPELTIHRGTHEIGGSCIELSSSSGDTRIIFDIGLPLVNKDMSPFDWSIHRKSTLPQLLEKKIVPSIDGLYEDDNPTVTAVVLSHAHLDHYGLLRFVHSDIPIYMSEGTKSLAEVSNVFLNTDVKFDRIETFKMLQTFKVGEFAITPYLMDHSAPDAVAFLIDVDGQRIFYTGDFRGHGRKSILLDRITKDPPQYVNYLIMEGSMLGRCEGLFPDETSVERALYDIITSQKGLCYVFTSSQNLDRLVSIYLAARHSSKTLVIDLYTAFVLEKLSCISHRIPQFDWEGIRVLYSYYHAQKLADFDRALLYKYKRAKIEFAEIRDNPADKVLLAKDSRYFRNVITKLKGIGKATAVFSMWHGYLERSNLQEFLESNDIPLTEIHTSGHAYIHELEMLANALKPRWIIPIHTFYPEKFRDMFPNVIRVGDGQTISLG
jgi:ribonuclease J